MKPLNTPVREELHNLTEEQRETLASLDLDFFAPYWSLHDLITELHELGLIHSAECAESLAAQVGKLAEALENEIK